METTMTKTSKGHEFLNNFKDKDNQTIYDLIKKHRERPDYEIAKKLLVENNIKLGWQDADSETKKD